jgi:hypothetical protein
MKQSRGNRPIDSMTAEQIDKQLLANVEPCSACWSEATKTRET